jgi:transposase-like protein
MKVFFDKFISASTVWRLLPPTLTKSRKHWILAIDGTWLHRNGVIMIYRDITHGENLFWSYHSSESYEAIGADLNTLTTLLGSHQPSGVISDWKGSIVSGVSSHFDHLPHQRCLMHVEREIKRYLPKYSPFEFTRELRSVGLNLIRVEAKDEARLWKAGLIKWHTQHGHHLVEKTYSQTEINTKGQPRWWYAHKDLRRAWNLLSSDWYPFFIHLDHQLIPKTNNSIEGVNSQAKRILGNHRGMKTPQQVSFLFWYLIFTRTKTKADLKKVWDYWKTQKSS